MRASQPSNICKETNHYQPRKCKCVDHENSVKKIILEVLATSRILFCATGVRAQRSSLASQKGAFSPHSLVHAMISAGPCTSQSVKDIIEELIGSSSALSVTTQCPTHKPRKTINEPLRINDSQKYKPLVKESFQIAWVYKYNSNNT